LYRQLPVQPGMAWPAVALQMVLEQSQQPAWVQPELPWQPQPPLSSASLQNTVDRELPSCSEG
jgi:hypothetical protein